MSSNTIEFSIPVEKCGTNALDIDSEDGEQSKRGFENIVVFQNDPVYQEQFDHARMIVCRYSVDDDFDMKDKRVIFKPIVIDMLDVVSIPIQDERGEQSRVDCWMEISKGRFPQTTEIDSAVKVGSPLTLAIFVRDPRKRTDIRIKDCYAYDDPKVAESNGPALLQLTDFDGCPTKPKLIEVWKRTQDTGSTGATIIAFTTVTAFKFPDRPDLQLTCNIELCRNKCASRCSSEMPDSISVGDWSKAKVDDGSNSTQSTQKMEEEEEESETTKDTEEKKEDEDETKEENTADEESKSTGRSADGDTEMEKKETSAETKEENKEDGEEKEDKKDEEEESSSEKSEDSADTSSETDSDSEAEKEEKEEPEVKNEETTEDKSSEKKEEAAEKADEENSTEKVKDTTDGDEEEEEEGDDSSKSVEAEKRDAEDEENSITKDEDEDEDEEDNVTTTTTEAPTTTTTTTTMAPTTTTTARSSKNRKRPNLRRTTTQKAKTTTTTTVAPKLAAQTLGEESEVDNSISASTESKKFFGTNQMSTTTLRPLKELMNFAGKARSKATKAIKKVTKKAKTTTTTSTTTTTTEAPTTTTKASSKKIKKVVKKTSNKSGTSLAKSIAQEEKAKAKPRRARHPSTTHPDEHPDLHGKSTPVSSNIERYRDYDAHLGTGVADLRSFYTYTHYEPQRIRTRSRTVRSVDSVQYDSKLGVRILGARVITGLEVI